MGGKGCEHSNFGAAAHDGPAAFSIRRPAWNAGVGLKFVTSRYKPEFCIQNK
jgi:hypothetical protein